MKCAVNVGFTSAGAVMLTCNSKVCGVGAEFNGVRHACHEAEAGSLGPRKTGSSEISRPARTPRQLKRDCALLNINGLPCRVNSTLTTNNPPLGHAGAWPFTRHSDLPLPMSKARGGFAVVTASRKWPSV